MPILIDLHYYCPYWATPCGNELIIVRWVCSSKGESSSAWSGNDGLIVDHGRLIPSVLLLLRTTVGWWCPWYTYLCVAFVMGRSAHTWLNLIKKYSVSFSFSSWWIFGYITFVLVVTLDCRDQQIHSAKYYKNMCLLFFSFNILFSILQGK